MLELKAGPMLEHDFEPLFKLEHMLKDVRHCLAEAERLGARMQLGAEAEQRYTASRPKRARRAGLRGCRGGGRGGRGSEIPDPT